MFLVEVDFGEGALQYFNIKDDTIVIVKVYETKASLKITTKILSVDLMDSQYVNGNFILIFSSKDNSIIVQLAFVIAN